MKRYIHVLVLLVLAGFGGCSGCNPTYISHDYDVDTDFSRYRTYSWMPQEKMNSEKSMHANPLVENRIKRAVAKNMSRKGFTPDAIYPDLLLVFHVGLQDITEISTTGYGYGYGFGGGNTRVEQFQEGTFILDMVDSGTRKLVWRGIAEGVLEDNPTAKKLDKDVNDMIDRLLRKFPPPVD